MPGCSCTNSARLDEGHTAGLCRDPLIVGISQLQPAANQHRARACIDQHRSRRRLIAPELGAGEHRRCATHPTGFALRRRHRLTPPFTASLTWIIRLSLTEGLTPARPARDRPVPKRRRSAHIVDRIAGGGERLPKPARLVREAAPDQRRFRRRPRMGRGPTAPSATARCTRRSPGKGEQLPNSG
jgi:hypothetical protein